MNAARAVNKAHLGTTMIRRIVSSAMRKSKLSRTQLAELMTSESGLWVTERMLNNYAAESRKDFRFPAELIPSFCKATGDFRLLICCVEASGLHVVDDDAMAVLELGREYLRGKRAAASIAALETRLEGVTL